MSNTKASQLYIKRDYAMRGYHIFIGDIDLREASMNYYDLPKEQRWLEDSPYNIGGRDTDIGQIALSLRQQIKDLYPINQVPSDIVGKLSDLEVLCNQTEEAIQGFISFVSERRLTTKAN